MTLSLFFLALYFQGLYSIHRVETPPAFYCVPAAAHEALLEKLDDIELNAIADQRLNNGQVFIRVSFDEL